MAKRPKEHTKAQKENRKQNPRCVICGETENVESHHLFEYAFGGTADLNNLVTLCHEHHMAVHNGEISLITIL